MDYTRLASMEFSRQEYWSGQPFPSPGDLPDPGIKPGSPALQVNSLPAEPAIDSPLGSHLGRFWFGAVFWRTCTFLLDVDQGVEMLDHRVGVC